MADEKNGPEPGSEPQVVITILAEHLRAIVTQLNAVIAAADEAAVRTPVVPTIPHRPPNFLIGPGCQGAITSARAFLEENTKP